MYLHLNYCMVLHFVSYFNVARMGGDIFFVAQQPYSGPGRLILEISRSHSDTHTLVRTPLDEGLARLRDLYLTTHNTHKNQTSMPPAGFEPAIPAR
jgi:hypothetical protein